MLFGHVMWKNKQENLVVTCKIEGERGKGRMRKQIVDQIKEWANAELTVDLLRRAAERKLIDGSFDKAFKKKTSA